MELDQGFPVVLCLDVNMPTFVPLNGMDSAYTLEDIVKRVEGIPVVHVDIGRTLARRVASLGPK
jgi:hypothetical protein